MTARPVLVLLNGTPASGKSTLARGWAARHPLAIALDIDIVRSMLGGWRDDPLEAGSAARSLALAMIGAHLRARRDVIVPQYLSQADFIDQLEVVAETFDADFAEIVLSVDPDTAERRFTRRADAHGADDVHGPLVGESMDEVIGRHRRFVEGRPHARLLAAGNASGYANVEDLEATIRRARRLVDEERRVRNRPFRDGETDSGLGSRG